MGSTSQTRKKILSPVLSISHYPQVYGNSVPPAFPPDNIIADSAQTKQMLLILNGKLDYIIHLISGNGHKPVSQPFQGSKKVRKASGNL